MSPSELPFVSVVVPTRNRSPLLAELLESLARQTYPSSRFEVIIVDNSSEDDTGNRVRAFAAVSPFTTRYIVKKNEGAAIARNTGLEAARGDFIAFIDSDCVASPGWLEAGLSVFESGFGLVQGKTLPRPDQLGRVPNPTRTISIVAEGPIYETCNMFYRREAIDRAGGFSREYVRHWGGEDLDLAFRVKKLGYRSAFAESALVFHAVFPMRVRDWLLEPVRSLLWPALVRKHPEVRQYLFARYFVTRTSALFDLGLLGAVLAFWVSPWAALLVVPFFVERFLASSQTRLPLRFLRLPFLVFRNGVAFVALLLGSIRHRSLLL